MEIPRLGRGGSRSLTFPGVLTLSRRSESARQFTKAGEWNEFTRPGWFSSSAGSSVTSGHGFEASMEFCTACDAINALEAARAASSAALSGSPTKASGFAGGYLLEADGSAQRTANSTTSKCDDTPFAAALLAEKSAPLPSRCIESLAARARSRDASTAGWLSGRRLSLDCALGRR